MRTYPTKVTPALRSIVRLAAALGVILTMTACLSISSYVQPSGQHGVEITISPADTPVDERLSTEPLPAEVLAAIPAAAVRWREDGWYVNVNGDTCTAVKTFEPDEEVVFPGFLEPSTGTVLRNVSIEISKNPSPNYPQYTVSEYCAASMVLTRDKVHVHEMTFCDASTVLAPTVWTLTVICAQMGNRFM